MFDPSKRLGADDEGGKKKPGLMIAVGFDPHKRLGADDGEDKPAPVDEASDADKMMDDAAKGIATLILKKTNASMVGVDSLAAGMREYLEAFFHAADLKPHKEGEHEGEAEEETEGREVEEEN